MVRNIIKVFLMFFLLGIFGVSKTQIVKAEISSQWSETTSLDYPVSNHSTVTQNNKIFVINGSSLTGATHSETLESVTSDNGNIQEWLTTATSLNPPLIGLEATKINGYSYIAGGLIDLINGVYTTVPTVSESEYSNNVFGN